MTKFKLKDKTKHLGGNHQQRKRLKTQQRKQS